ncbi:DUF6114 domain-containing protein [Actinokineospora globicatena]|uniref:DUF6114 domain-containing protein n=1 Tax=Actinokineospora globicatena TaxID=103729 RepID=UPI0020A29930|nr:DUF6114 domain-containing protein [Actinokineospora globicatena]MCP2304887.1 hypothetical protein [Actinokineospora globicatena]GLW77732.1 hypothetical protein Aglo01_22140 [Actinokineospora globicatena]GLW85599.1 hypothetical protein Aglo02_32390 [Actinokineospora globicatena]
MVGRFWRSFTAWRHTRPFWGGLFVLLGAVPIFVLPLAPIKVLVASGIAGVSGLLLGSIMAVLAVSLWFTPQTRVVVGLIAVLVSVAAFPLTNLGGFFIGSLLGVLGGAMAASWAPRKVKAAPADEPVAA